ncbi:MAG: MgtC/SapB family protein, partial [Archangium sp.]|nr:MgtC/SapB family protein [Archangium sp.]
MCGAPYSIRLSGLRIDWRGTRFHSIVLPVERFEPYTSLGLALLSGLLIGLEREHSRPVGDPKRPFFGGIRTYPLIALTGAAASLLAHTLGPWPLVVGGLTLIVLLAISYWRDANEGHTGVTSELSAMLTYFLGALALAGDSIGPFSRRVFVVASIAVVSTILLSAKTELRQLSTKISRDDVIAALKFLLVAVVVLPVLPNEAFGPWGVLNPFRIGVLVTVIAGVGLVGYVAIRLLGSGRGMLLTGAVGGIVSSTAVTLAAAGRAKQTPALAKVAALSVLVASSVMFIRLLAVLAAVEPNLFREVLMPISVMGGVMLIGTLILYVRGGAAKNDAGEVKIDNPFELTSALKFGALFVGVMLVSRWAQTTFGNSGAYVTGFLA